jgi:hypothetical protein
MKGEHAFSYVSITVAAAVKPLFCSVVDTWRSEGAQQKTDSCNNLLWLSLVTKAM